MGISEKCFWKQHCLGKYISVGLCWSVGSLSVTVTTGGLCGGLVSYNLACLGGLLKLSLMLWSIGTCPCCNNMESQECGEKRPLELPAPPPAQCRTSTRSAWLRLCLAKSWKPPCMETTASLSGLVQCCVTHCKEFFAHVQCEHPDLQTVAITPSYTSCH